MSVPKDQGNGFATSAVPQRRKKKIAIRRHNLFSRDRVYEALDGILHMLGSSVLLLVLLWHFTPDAEALPGAKGFGWFYKFLTHCSWTLQSLQYFVTTLYLIARRKSSFWGNLGPFVDDISCTAFCFATLVTAQFWVLHWITGGLVEPSTRPPWLGFMVHVFNALLAWTDVLMSHPRTFSKRSLKFSFSLAFVYALWIALCRYMNGRYPYPFMNKMHPVLAFALMSPISFMVLRCMHYLGSKVAAVSSAVLNKGATEITPEKDARKTA